MTWHGDGQQSSPELSLVPKSLGRYRVLEFLGSGGFARVYLAADLDLDRQVAVKVPRLERFDSERDLDVFLNEAKVMARLDHPGIVQVYDVGNEDGTRYIVTQLITGQSLSDRVRQGSLTHMETANLIAHCADAIHFAHKQQLYHRDLKPGNILLDDDGRPHVADFGLAVSRVSQSQHAGEIAGTLAFMAPEQLRGESHLLDGRSDIWSLGVILYSMLTGQLPFSGKPAIIRKEVLERNPTPLRQLDERIPQELERICLKCLQRSSSDRYSTAFDLAIDLHAWLTDDPDSTPAPDQPAVMSEQRTDSGVDATTAHRTSVSSLKRAAWMWWTPIAVVSAAAVALGAFGLGPDGAGTDGVDPPTLIRSPFEIDAWGGIDVWENLLATRPRELIWPEAHPTAPWRPERREALIDVSNVGYLSLGQTQSKSYRLQVTISISSLDGTAGLFWGYQDAPSETGELMPQCHVLCVTRYNQKGEWKARLNLERHFFGSGIGINGDNSISIDFPGRGKHDLEIQVAHDRFISVKWRGQLEEKLISVPQRVTIPPLSCRGQFGVMAGMGTAVFGDCRINIFEKPGKDDHDQQ